MRTGFWTLNDDNFDCLHDTEIGDVYYLLHGFCPVFAQALSNCFGYDVYGAFTYDDEIDGDAIVHMFCETSDGHLVDVRGITDNWESFMENFEDEFCDLEDDVYVTKVDVAGFEKTPEYEMSIALIQRYAEYYTVV